MPQAYALKWLLGVSDLSLAGLEVRDDNIVFIDAEFLSRVIEGRLENLRDI